jgi:WASH complex subunit strumpellin
LSHYDKYIKDLLLLFYFQATKYANKLEKMHIPLEKYLKEGVLSEEFVLDNIPKMMNVLRDSNVTLRWLMLHTSALSPSKSTSVFLL